jgi:hypothetical protein
MRATFPGIKNDAQARRALEEIERLVRDAEAAGLRLDPWLGELAQELRSVLPEIDAAGAATIARRIAADPRVSFAAQGRLRSETMRLLRG